MFYADFVLSKKGPLARIWLAAHWDKKLTKTQIFETNIESSIERILKPKVKLALRTSGHLMLGVVRIYSRKTKYLLADCNEAFVKIKMAFRPGMVDLPEDHREAAVNAVTLPEVFHDFDSVMPDLNNVDIEAQFTLNQSRADEITMREDYGNVPTISVDDGGFGSDGFGAIDITRRSVSLESSLQQMNVIFGEAIDVGVLNDDNDFDDHFIPPSPCGMSSDGSRPPSPIAAAVNALAEAASASALADIAIPSADDVDPFLPPIDLIDQPAAGTDLLLPSIDQHIEDTESHQNQNTEQTTLLHNEEESFALAPVDASALRGLPKTKRKRKLIVDEVKNISGDEMKGQLSDTSDIVITLDLAPPTKRLMHWKETGGVEKLFALPGKCIPSSSLFKNYQRHLTSKAAPNEDGEERDNVDPLRDGNQDGLDLENLPAAAATPRRGRKRKLAAIEEEAEQAAAAATPPMATATQLDQPAATVTQMEQPVDALTQDPNQELFSFDDHLGHDSATPGLNAAGDNSVTLNLNAGGDVRLPLAMNPGSDDPLTLGLDAADDPCNSKMDFQDQGQGLFNFNEDLDHNPATPGMMNVGGGVTPCHSKLDFPDQNLELFNFNDDLDHNPVTPGLMNAGGGITPWHDTDYDNPASVEPEEERGDDETAEQFEERILNKRAGHLYSTIRMRISTGVTTTFCDLTTGNQRKHVAQKFYSILVLKKYKILELMQDQPYGTISLTKGSNFDDPKL